MLILLRLKEVFETDVHNVGVNYIKNQKVPFSINDYFIKASEGYKNFMNLPEEVSLISTQEPVAELVKRHHYISIQEKKIQFNS